MPFAVPLQDHSVPDFFEAPNMVLLAGSGQNVGKSTFAERLIDQLKRQGVEVYGLKITPHFHEQKPKNLLIETETYQVSLEKEKQGTKDTNRFLAAGADAVFFMQTRSDLALREAFDYVYRMNKPGVAWVCESGGLRRFVQPALFFLLTRKDEIIEKASAKEWQKIADRQVVFENDAFNLSLEQIAFRNGRFELI